MDGLGELSPRKSHGYRPATNKVSGGWPKGSGTILAESSLIGCCPLHVMHSLEEFLPDLPSTGHVEEETTAATSATVSVTEEVPYVVLKTVLKCSSPLCQVWH